MRFPPHIFTLLALLLTSLLAGCGPGWHNPNLVDQSKSKQKLNQDMAYCEKWSSSQVDTAPMNDENNYGITPYQRMNSYQTDLMLGRGRMNAYDQCMKGKGWVKN